MVKLYPPPSDESKQVVTCISDTNCFSKNCTFKHNNEQCKNWETCRDFDCTLRHAKNRIRPCKHGLHCKKYITCAKLFLHPNCIKLENFEVSFIEKSGIINQFIDKYNLEFSCTPVLSLTNCADRKMQVKFIKKVLSVIGNLKCTTFTYNDVAKEFKKFLKKSTREQLKEEVIIYWEGDVMQIISNQEVLIDDQILMNTYHFVPEKKSIIQYVLDNYDQTKLAYKFSTSQECLIFAKNSDYSKIKEEIKSHILKISPLQWKFLIKSKRFASVTNDVSHCDTENFLMISPFSPDLKYDTEKFLKSMTCEFSFDIPKNLANSKYIICGMAKEAFPNAYFEIEKNFKSKRSFKQKETFQRQDKIHIKPQKQQGSNQGEKQTPNQKKTPKLQLQNPHSAVKQKVKIQGANQKYPKNSSGNGTRNLKQDQQPTQLLIVCLQDDFQQITNHLSHLSMHEAFVDLSDEAVRILNNLPDTKKPRFSAKVSWELTNKQIKLTSISKNELNNAKTYVNGWLDDNILVTIKKDKLSYFQKAWLGKTNILDSIQNDFPSVKINRNKLKNNILHIKCSKRDKNTIYKKVQVCEREISKILDNKEYLINFDDLTREWEEKNVLVMKDFNNTKYVVGTVSKVKAAIKQLKNATKDILKQKIELTISKSEYGILKRTLLSNTQKLFQLSNEFNVKIFFEDYPFITVTGTQDRINDICEHLNSTGRATKELHLNNEYLQICKKKENINSLQKLVPRSVK